MRQNSHLDVDIEQTPGPTFNLYVENRQWTRVDSIIQVEGPHSETLNAQFSNSLQQLPGARQGAADNIQRIVRRKTCQIKHNKISN